ncbi:hypothetical protein ACOSQ2_033091 [Xanthoceras sorbifolium]
MAPPAPESSSSYSVASFTVTQEQFNMFHNIDRLLFTRLVLSLRRDPGESMQVMALWMWLEQAGWCRGLVDNMLRWPDTLITSLADEAVLCLNFTKSVDDFPDLSFKNDNIFDVPFIQSMTQNRVSLRFFRDNRSKILLGISRNVNEVCTRAFKDILQLHAMQKNAVFEHKSSEDYRGGEEILHQQQQQQLDRFGPVISPVLPPVMYHNIGVGDHLGHHHHNPLHHHHQMVSSTNPHYFDQGFDVYDLAVQRSQQVLNNHEIGEMLRGMQISDNHNNLDHEQQENDQVAPDERTIFLTFSKGYPISESEIRDFFSRIYGECIEAIFMQEVAAVEQPLYARLVVNPCSIIEVILSGKSKAKFSINGKHVWARKYVRKTHKSPPRSSSPLQQI